MMMIDDDENLSKIARWRGIHNSTMLLIYVRYVIEHLRYYF